MWFEKWAYHPALREHLTMTQEMRKAWHSLRGEVARVPAYAPGERGDGGLGLRSARSFGDGLRDAFDELDARFGISRYCTLGDFPGYFTWPMFQANRGELRLSVGSADSAGNSPHSCEIDRGQPRASEVGAVLQLPRLSTNRASTGQRGDLRLL